MILRRFISVLFITIYAIVFSHDFVPHHHHTDVCISHDHNNNPIHPDDCHFPFHQHSMDEVGVFLNTSGIVVNFDVLCFSPNVLFSYSDFFEFKNDKYQVDFISPIYKGPNISSVPLRGPPIS